MVNADRDLRRLRTCWIASHALPQRAGRGTGNLLLCRGSWAGSTRHNRPGQVRRDPEGSRRAFALRRRQPARGWLRERPVRNAFRERDRRTARRRGSRPPRSQARLLRLAAARPKNSALRDDLLRRLLGRSAHTGYRSSSDAGGRGGLSLLPDFASVESCQ